MLAQYEPAVKATIVFLRLLGVKVNNGTVNETLQNHPDWPSLLCISDSLQKWNIPNAAGKISTQDIDLLPVPFLVRVSDTDNALTVVTDVTETHISYYAYKDKKPITAERNTFLQKWDGIYLMAEPDKASGEKNFFKVKKKLLLRAIVPLSLLLLLTALSFYGLQSVFNGNINGVILMQYLVYIASIAVSALLVWYEIDRNNPLLKKVCTGISKGNCEVILTGSGAKFLGWLSWSEIGFFYFSGSLLSLLFVPGAINVLAWFSVLAMPYIIFSLYYQWRVAKHWCVLCLAVQALLLISGINILTRGLIQQPFTLSAPILLKTAGCFLLPVLCWYTIKPYFMRLQQAVANKREYLRIKFNAEIFETLLKKQKPVTIPATDIGINIGKADATHTLIKVCNPYCGPCASAHPKIEKLLEAIDYLRVKIIFTAPDDDKNSMSKPVKHLLAIAEKQDEQLTKKALDDWYLAEKKDYDAFAARYPVNGELLTQGAKLAAMSKWCREMDVIATPTFFLDGNQLPDSYRVEDLEYFLLA
ncbi:MAG: thioredoxin domain-containing protein [Agriterribacter sp.]